MKEISDKEDLVTRFLLAQVTERERAEVEDRLLADEDFYQQMLAAEGDLMDAYARGELPPRKRALFAEKFLSSERQGERVHFARGLVEATTILHKKDSASAHVAATPAETAGHRGWLASLFTPAPAFRYALAAVVLIVMVVAVWLLFQRMRAPVEPQQARTESTSAQTPPELANESGQNDSGAGPGQPEGAPPADERRPEREAANDRPAQRESSIFATITLAPGSLRDGAAASRLDIPREATHLSLRLQLEADDYQNYRATVSTPEGRRIWTGRGRKDRAKDARSVTLTLPAAALKPGDYIVELSDAGATGRSEPAAQYSFRITQQ